MPNFEVVQQNQVISTDRFAQRRIKAQGYFDQLLKDHPTLENRPYQVDLAAIYASRGLDICNGGQGLGKTLITGLTLLTALDPFPTRPGAVQIVVPNLLYARSRWLVDFKRFAALNGFVEIINSEKQLLKSQAPIWIYDMNFARRKSKTLPGTKRKLARLLAKQVPEYLVIDECHHFQKGSDRSKAIEIVRKRAHRVLFLSGTVSDGRLKNIHYLLKLCYGRHFKLTEREFLSAFEVKTQVQSNYLTGSNGIDELQPRYMSQLSPFKVADYAELMVSKIHRVTLDQSFVKRCVSLPTPNIQTELLSMDAAHRADYKQLVHDRLNDLRACRQYGANAAAQAKARSILQPLIECSNFPDYDTAKIRRTLELVDEFNKKGLKTVIFNSAIGSGRKIASALKSKFGADKINRLYATDEFEQPPTMKLDQREQVLSDFLFGPIIASVLAIRIANESIDLTQASAVIFYDCPWDVIKLNQGISRVVRPGAVNNFVEIRYLAHENSIDEHMLNLNFQKQKQMDLLLDYSLEASKPISVLDLLDLILGSES